MTAPALAIALMFGSTPISPIDTPVETPISMAAPMKEATEQPQTFGEADPMSSIVVTDDSITVVARSGHAPGDPLEDVNKQAFAVTQAVDRAFIGPAAHIYEHAVPSPARSGLRNFFRNLHEPVIFVNFLLQLKPGKAVKTLGRFALNSTVGAAGLMDIAKRRPFNLPYRPNGFANSLAFYGVKPGPFLYLPIIGPTTLRDLFGRSMDAMINPLPGGPMGGTAYAMSSTAVKSLNRRVDFDGTLQELRDDNPHAYASLREHYLAKREAQIAALHSPKRKANAPVELTGPVSIPSPLAR